MKDMMRLVEPQIPALRRYARALLRDRSAADDLVQDCLERAISHWHQRRPDGDARTWLFAILHNLAVSGMRRTMRRGVHTPLDEVDERALAQAPAQEGRLMQRDILGALESLPEEQRSVLLLVSVEELSYAETARVLSIPLGTVMSRLARAREKLREAMSGGNVVALDGSPFPEAEMSAERPVSEDDLQAYVDDVLAPAERRRIEAYLDRHPDVALRVGDYAGQREALRLALGEVAAEPIPPELSLAGLLEAHQLRDEARKAAGFRWRDWRSTAAGLALLLLGGGVGWALHGIDVTPPGGIASLAQEAADSYAVYAPDHVRPVELRADASAQLVDWVSGRLRHPVSVPDLSHAGYRFMGGRLVATAHGPAALFLYDDDHGTRLAMLVRPMAVDKDMPMAEHELGDTGGVTWAEKGIGYSLVGPASASALHPLADEVRRQISGDA